MSGSDGVSLVLHEKRVEIMDFHGFPGPRPPAVGTLRPQGRGGGGSKISFPLLRASAAETDLGVGTYPHYSGVTLPTGGRVDAGPLLPLGETAKKVPMSEISTSSVITVPPRPPKANI